MDSKKLPWGLVWRDEKLAKTELQKAGKEGRRRLIAAWAPSLPQKKVPCTQCGTWTHRCVDERYWHTMPDRAPYWEKRSFIYMPKEPAPSVGVLESSRGVEAKEREQHAIWEEERLGGQEHIKGNAYQEPLRSGETQKPLANITGSPKSLLKKVSKETAEKKTYSKQQEYWSI